MILKTNYHSLKISHSWKISAQNICISSSFSQQNCFTYHLITAILIVYGHSRSLNITCSLLWKRLCFSYKISRKYSLYHVWHWSIGTSTSLMCHLYWYNKKVFHYRDQECKRRLFQLFGQSQVAINIRK